MIADIFSDKRHDPLPQFVCQFSGLNPALGDSCLMLFTNTFKLFFDDELVGKLFSEGVSGKFLLLSNSLFC